MTDVKERIIEDLMNLIGGRCTEAERTLLIEGFRRMTEDQVYLLYQKLHEEMD